jgi:hypothetical protein
MAALSTPGRRCTRSGTSRLYAVHSRAHLSKSKPFGVWLSFVNRLSGPWFPQVTTPSPGSRI